MTITPYSPPSRWSRFIPRQFSLRALFVVITVAALGTWWFIQVPQGTITEQQAKQIQFGMKRDEVRAILGAPQSLRKGAWTFEIRDSAAYLDEKTMLVLTFKRDDKIGSIGRASDSILAPPDDAKSWTSAWP